MEKYMSIHSIPDLVIKNANVITIDKNLPKAESFAIKNEANVTSFIPKHQRKISFLKRRSHFIKKNISPRHQLKPIG